MITSINYSIRNLLLDPKKPCEKIKQKLGHSDDPKKPCEMIKQKLGHSDSENIYSDSSGNLCDCTYFAAIIHSAKFCLALAVIIKVKITIFF